MSANPPDLIYKVAPAALWAEAEKAGIFEGAPIDKADGFIHFSTASQLRETLRRHFARQNDLVLVEVVATGLGAALKWEVSRGGDLFPHLYAPLEIDRVRQFWPIAVDADGQADLPKGV